MWFKYIVFTVYIAVCVDGYSTGAPETACVDMTPRHHNIPPQKTSPPYTVTTSTKIVKAGSPMEVIITAKDPTRLIRGLLLQARQKDSPVGTFLVTPDNSTQLLNCGSPGNAVTHKKHNNNDDKQMMSFVWTPPTNLNDEIKFRATVVQTGQIFWVGVESAPVKVTS